VVTFLIQQPSTTTLSDSAGNNTPCHHHVYTPCQPSLYEHVLRLKLQLLLLLVL